MRLADFIEENASKIVEGAELFAEAHAPAGIELDPTVLRDHIPEILAAIVLDLRTPQSSSERHAKSEGRKPGRAGAESAASEHGRSRAKYHFDVNHLFAEYRALRASVLRLWAMNEALTASSLDDMTRFNEAIDQAVAESLFNFNKEVETGRQVFIGILGHDLRGPLAAIVGTAELLSHISVGSPYRALAERICTSSMRMSRLLDNLLVYSKTQLGTGIEIKPAHCDLSAPIAEEIDLLRAALPRAIITFHQEGPTHGLFDASRVREALHNLVTNAFKYGRPGSEIVVSLSGTSESVQLRVRNLGDPLPDQWAGSIYDPLKRGDVVARDGEGASLGLGLFVVREIVNAHLGQLEGRSGDGETTFTITLPTNPYDEWSS